MSCLRVFFLSVVFFLLCGITPAQAVITVTTGTTDSQSGSGTLALTTPTGTAVGDVLIVQLVAQPGVSISAPTGWGVISAASTDDSNGLVQQKIYYLNVSGTPASSYSWTISNNYRQIAGASIYTVHGANPVDCGSSATTNCAGAIQSGGGNQITAPNVQSQPPTYPAMSLRMAFFGTANGDLTITNWNTAAAQGPSLSTQNYYYWFNWTLGGYGVALSGEYYAMAAASNGGSEGASINGNSNGSVGSTLILTVKSSSSNLTCFTGDFSGSTLSSDWVVKNVSGSFTPSTNNNRLRLTDNNVRESTAVSLQRLLPGSGNYIQLSFKYYGYGGNGADGIAAILSDASVTPQPGGFGGSLGYSAKATTPAVAGFAGGWLGVGLDEFGNFSNTAAGSAASGSCAPGLTCATSAVRNSVSIRGSQPNYYWINGTGTLNPTVTTSSGHSYRITIDSTASSSANVTVERDTNGGQNYSRLLGPTNMLAVSGQAAVPSNFILSLTGSTGDYTNYHEISDLSVCALKMNSMTTIDHYQFAINSNPLTCTPAAITVTACMNAACTVQYTADKVTATLTATTGGNADDGWVGGNTQTFSSGSTLYLRESTTGTYSIGVSGSTPSLLAFNSATALCSINNSGYSAANCSNIGFADSGFLLTVPTQTSGMPSSGSSTFSVAAVKKSDNSLSCVPAFADGKSRGVKFWYGYVDPTSGSYAPAVNGATLGTSQTSAASQALTFNSSGVATGLTLNYADAGKLNLFAEYDGSATTADSGLVMTGNTSFVVVPYALCVDSPDTNWNWSYTYPGNWSKYFTTAGQAFNLRVTGKAYSAGVSDACSLLTTPNYAQQTVPLASAVYAPSGGNAGALSASSMSVGLTNGSVNKTGIGTVSQSESEVGVFTISAGPGIYMDQIAGPTGSGVFGRFIPAGFTVSGSLTNRQDVSTGSASTFTYLGEPLAAALTFTAVNTSGAPTSNYTDSYARMPVSCPITGSLGSNGIAFGAGSTALNSRLSSSASACPAFSVGKATFSGSVTIARGNVVDGPYTTQFGVAFKDSDGVGAYVKNFDWSASGNKDGTALSVSVAGSTQSTTILRFGRMRLENAYGSPLLKLNVPAYTQYWNGTSFQKNTDDSATVLTVPTSSRVPPTTAAALYCNGGVGLYGTLAGVTASMNGMAAGSTATLASGDAGLWLSKPTNTGGGYLDVAPAVPAYLKYNWDGAANSCGSSVAGDMFDDNPRARVRFGVPRNDKIIYLREVY